MNVEIGDATLDEIPRLCELLGLLFDQEAEFKPDPALQAKGLRQIMESAEWGRILVARSEGRVVGMVNLLFTVSTALGGPVALVEDMVVELGHRGNGIGSRLLRGAIAAAEASGCRRVTLLTDRDNATAQRFYRRHGFDHSAMIPMRRLM